MKWRWEEHKLKGVGDEYKLKRQFSSQEAGHSGAPGSREIRKSSIQDTKKLETVARLL